MEKIPITFLGPCIVSTYLAIGFVTFLVYYVHRLLEFWFPGNVNGTLFVTLYISMFLFVFWMLGFFLPIKHDKEEEEKKKDDYNNESNHFSDLNDLVEGKKNDKQ